MALTFGGGFLAIEELSREVWQDFKNKPTIETRNYILMHYLGLVKDIAQRLVYSYKNHVDYDDLYSCGIFGLMDAIEKYDVGRNIKFSTYATWRVKGAIIDYIREQDWLPKSKRQKLKQVEDAYTQLEGKYGQPPSEDQVASHLGISVSELNKTLSESYSYQIISMDEKIMEVLNQGKDISTQTATPEAEFMEEELKDVLAKAIDTLTQNEKMVTSLYYFDELNQKEIGKVMGLSESRISQLHAKAVIKIRSYLEKNYLN